MRPALPDKLGLTFWVSLIMAALSLVGTALGLVYGWGYRTGIAVIFGIFAVCQLVQHVRAVRLGRALKHNPELSKIYYSPKR